MTDLLDHDTLCKLLREDPDGFEEYRKGILQGFLESVPEEHRKRLEQQQWLLDGELRKLKNPEMRARRCYELMIDSLIELNDSLSELRGVE